MEPEQPNAAGPDPQRVGGIDELARELELLRARAAIGTRKRKVSLDELANRVGESRSTVHSYVSGKYLVPPDILDRIVIALGASPAEQREWSEAWFRVSASLDAQRRAKVRSAASRDTVPHQLPLDVDGFTGRTVELAALDKLLAVAGEDTSAMVISAVAGTGGVGKTALAVHWAHQVAEAFPDGQLWVDLRGYDPDRPVQPCEALAGCLRALGVAGADIPHELAERAALYRSLLAGRRVLVVLDNARDGEQVRPLLPGTPSCLVVVTSRDSLAGLVARHGAHRIDLDVLPAQDAIILLRRLIGARVDADAAAAAAVADRCARLPLALRVAAELAVAYPAATLGDLADDLADEARRLDRLDAGNDRRTAVRTVFSWSYRQLPAEAARTFRLLGLNPGPHIDVCATAALVDVAVDRARQLLETLHRAHLVHETGPGRYAMHDLLRVWATERTYEEDAEPSRRAALTRLFDHYLHTASVAMDLLYPHEQQRRPRVAAPATITATLDGEAAARCWLDTERANLLATAAHGGSHGWPATTVRLAATIWRHLDTGAHHADARTLHEHALSAAGRSHDRAGEASARRGLGIASWRTGQYGQAAEHFRQALAVYRDIGDRDGQASAVNNLGLALARIGRYDQAVEYFHQSLAMCRQFGDLYRQAGALTNLGTAYAKTCQYGQAVRHYQQALAASIELADRASEADALSGVGAVYARVGRYDQATQYLQRALARCRDVGDRYGEADVLNGLGTVYRRTGQHDRAAAHHRHALTVGREIGNPACQADALSGIGAAYERAGQYEAATDCQRQALALSSDIGDRGRQAHALNGIGNAARAAGRSPDALVAHREAHDCAGKVGDRHEQARASEGMGHALDDLGRSGQAREHWRHALAVYEELEVPEADEIRARLTAAPATGADAGAGAGAGAGAP